MTTPGRGPSPFDGSEVPFGEIGTAMARGACLDAGAMRALVATLVAIGPHDRLETAAETLQVLGDAGTVRGILISEGSEAAPVARVAGNTVALQGLQAPYVNNAVAALRLSSLPTLVWWRGGRPETLDEVAHLADRIVLDEEEPEASWRRAATLFENSAFSDLRWARLTQWRALMAHFFDIPEVRSASTAFTRLHITGADRMSARLFAAWLTTSIAFREGFTVDITSGDPDVPLQSIELGDHGQELVIAAGGQNCLKTSVSVRGHRNATSVVSLVNQTLTTVLTEELRIRARDLAFERAVQALIAG